MRANISSRLGTETPLIKDLISDIKKGEIKIPQFQRKFVWKEDQAIKLIDSIANNYPTGSLLFWRTSTKLATERNVGDFKLPETDDLSPTNYVLDGQQRLTVIYSSFGAPDEDDGFTIGYDIIQEEFIKLPDKQELHIFPLRWIFETTKLLNFRTALNSHAKAVELQEKLDSLIGIITNYRLPVVTLKDLSVEEVCPIFERINSSGTRLSTYDLMVAATWAEDFNLDEEVELIADSLRTKNFEDIEGDTVLKCLAAVKYKSIKKQYILSLRRLEREDMDLLVRKTKEALLRAVDLLTTEFGIYNWSFLPYEAIVVIICYVVYNKKDLTNDDILRMRKWFWISGFAERYRGAAESFISNDLQSIEEYIIKGKDVPGLFGGIPSIDEVKGMVFRSNNSRTRSFILLLASMQPKNITNGAIVDVQNALSIFNKKQYHHIYPQAYLKDKGISANAINSIVNICILAASENNYISDNDPNEYIPELIEKLGEQYELVFKSNLLPILSKEEYKKLAYEDFISLRVNLIHERISFLCNGKR
ncbi:DUF262 domain-containing protein [Clostridium boliviensis]|uniref:DUF262 domain-containing protein n=1 Tax=Clostridium boliviensis TaxID=318465 RepID=A0ABU4GHW9_9CLOT|nr:DUF262 domain-containing protein [Clostridium boliviensis]MDW2797207.1 DUF262 domain-containing protein [Clostridium boliviensis]